MRDVLDELIAEVVHQWRGFSGVHLKDAKKKTKRAIEKKTHSYSGSTLFSAVCSNFRFVCVYHWVWTPRPSGVSSSSLKTSDKVLSQLVLGIHRGPSSPAKKRGKKGEIQETSVRIKLSVGFFFVTFKVRVNLDADVITGSSGRCCTACLISARALCSQEVMNCTNRTQDETGLQVKSDTAAQSSAEQQTGSDGESSSFPTYGPRSASAAVDTISTCMQMEELQCHQWVF